MQCADPLFPDGPQRQCNFGGEIFTFYLILTAWPTARRRDRETSRLDWAVLPAFGRLDGV